MKKFKEYLRVYKYVVYDIATIILSYYLTIWIYFGDGTTFPYSHKALWLALIFIIPGKLLLFALLGIYKIMSRHASFEDFFRIVLVVTGSNLLLLLITLFINRPFIDERAFVLVTFIEVTGILFPRILRRSMEVVNYRVKTLKNVGDKTLIIGAGSAGEMALKEMVKNDKLTNIPVAFLDDNPEKLGKQIMGVSVVGTLDDLDKVIDKIGIQEVILAIKELPKHQYHVLVNKLVEKHIRVKKLNLIEDVKSSETALVDLKIEDLLNRPVINLDNQGISDFIKDEIVLVTGGGGSIGSELSRQIFDLKPKQLIILDIYENNAYEIQMELNRKVYKDKNKHYPKLDVRIGSVYNKVRLEEIFKEFKPTIVFHAAAYKHVPLMEDSAVESIRTNVLGTLNTAKLSTKYGVKKFVLVSSDKAVRSTNIMGASKRFAELIIMNEQKMSKTSFTAVRFGNVLGSNGSVIPLFKKQIEDGGPVTVTHKEITRYFMTIPESVSLILQCGAFAKNGELFILDMGEPVKIYEFAEKMIRLAGYRVDEDIKIEVVGLRPGEKLYEELLLDTNDPNIHKTENKLIFIENGNGNDLEMKLVDDLLNNLDSLENEEVKLKVSNIVKSYKQNTI
ncbi:polysaccharide biosynthesis protein [Acholeplasma laidlawii]|uniref:polysaccharide biosynthesis protein n=1 Tax=Acholeplasma laidlawii TaxID=2148 RepID=UPI0018C2F30C|nr:nucleoside-diphosphate sugar epimerase/dehydratase [Acholeplasma laidlawii]MBG0763214.1 polysaccharide biosynthesis protein [Acholeplasma laidlawii]